MDMGGAVGLCGRYGVCPILFPFLCLMEDHLLSRGLQLGGGPLLETPKPRVSLIFRSKNVR